MYTSTQRATLTSNIETNWKYQSYLGENVFLCQISHYLDQFKLLFCSIKCTTSTLPASTIVLHTDGISITVERHSLPWKKGNCCWDRERKGLSGWVPETKHCVWMAVHGCTGASVCMLAGVCLHIQAASIQFQPETLILIQLAVGP